MREREREKEKDDENHGGPDWKSLLRMKYIYILSWKIKEI